VYKNLAEARKAIHEGTTVIFRSEHPKEVHGFSGIFQSFEINTQKINEAKATLANKARVVELFTDVKRASGQGEWEYIREHCPERLLYDVLVAAFTLAVAGIDYRASFTGEATRDWSIAELQRLFREIHTCLPTVRQYADAWNFGVERTLHSLSFSAWEKLEGTKMVIQRDPHVTGRYHVFSFGSTAARSKSRYCIDNGKIIASSDDRRTTGRDMGRARINALIAIYEESITKAELTHQAPIIECILQGKDTVVPVQVHINKPYTPDEGGAFTSEILHDTVTWKKAAFVQGVTPPEGLDVSLVYTKDRWEIGTAEYGAILPHRGDDFTFAEQNNHYVCMHVSQYGTLVDTHGPVNQSLMPTLSITMRPQDVPESLREREGVEQVRVRIISNGRDAYVRFLDSV
jgi:hypothetical protein